MDEFKRMLLNILNIDGLVAMDGNERVGLSLESNSNPSSSSISSMSPLSPVDLKPDPSTLINFSPPPSSTTGPLSPNGIGGYGLDHHHSLLAAGGTQSSGSALSPSSGIYPPNHPLSGSKHLCSICGDRASGKHYGVYSCEGCKGFFKRTVRKDLTYACREERNCIIDKRQRNRCQYCRYQKCLSMGMKREAVQEERQRTKEREQSEGECTITASPASCGGGGSLSSGTPPTSTVVVSAEMPIERILEAERRVECDTPDFMDDEKDGGHHIYKATNKQLVQLVEWAKNIPHFTALPIEDQVLLLRAGWNELMIAAFSHRSIEEKEGIVLANGYTVLRDSAEQAGVDNIFDRVLSELVSKMREMNMDKTELGCLRTIILFNPGVKGLKSVQEVEQLRDKVYLALDEYTRMMHPDEPGRFAKLLLRLPALRSIGLKCLEHLFFYKLIGDTKIDTFLLDMLESHHHQQQHIQNNNHHLNNNKTLINQTASSS